MRIASAILILKEDDMTAKEKMDHLKQLVTRLLELAKKEHDVETTKGCNRLLDRIG